MIVIASPDLQAFQRRLGELSKMPGRDMKRIMSSTRRATETATKRAIGAQYGVKQSRAAKDIRTGPVQGSPPSFTIKGSNKPIGLRSYDARVSKKNGVSVVVEKADGRTQLRHVFAANGMSGNALLWERTGKIREMKAGRYAGLKREAIKPLFGPSVADMFLKRPLRDAVEIFALTKMSSELDRVINGILKRG